MDHYSFQHATSSGPARPVSRLPMPRSIAAHTPSHPPRARQNPVPTGTKKTRLRPLDSRERLSTVAQPGCSNGNATNWTPTHAISRLSTSTQPPAKPRPNSSLPTFHTHPKLPKAAYHHHSLLPPPSLRDHSSTWSRPATTQELPTWSLSGPGPGLGKKPSAKWTPLATPGERSTTCMRLSNGNTSSSDSFSQTSPTDGDCIRDKTTVRVKTARSRPSLAERTVETLSRLPSSQALRARASPSNFFEPEPFKSPSISATSTTSVTSITSITSITSASCRSRAGSSRTSSRPSLSRPGSSAGPGQEPAHPLKSQWGQFERNCGMPDVPGLPGLPPDRPVRGRRLGTLKAPSTPALRSRFQSQLSPSFPPMRMRVSRSSSPRPESGGVSAQASTKRSVTSSTCATQPRPAPRDPPAKPSASAPKKPSLAAAATSEKAFPASQRSSVTAASDRPTVTTPSLTTISNLISSHAMVNSPLQSKKTSTALREQIARAKAAKRAAAKLALSTHGSSAGQPASGGEAPLMVPTDHTFDFGLSDDAFNLQRDAISTSQVIKSRAARARTSGRLNIAALGLKEIPPEVLNMYSLQAIGTYDGTWAESIDLTRFVAADNELEFIDESLFPDVDPEDVLTADDDGHGSIFAGLETLDLHGNMLIALPAGLRRLNLMTSLNLSSNRLANNCLDVISQITPLRDLKLGGNLLWGTLDPCFGRLTNLEILDLHGNSLQRFPSTFSSLRRLRILNISENNFESLPFKVLANLPLTELNARKNKLTNVLFEEGVEVLPSLRNLDVSSNQLTALIHAKGSLAMPALTQLCVSVNRLYALPDVSSWKELITLAADENIINVFPDGFTSLQNLKHADFSSNDIVTVPAEVARMDNLNMLRLSGNPLRDKRFVRASVDELKDILAARLLPPFAESDSFDGRDGPIAEALTSNEASPLDHAFEGACSNTTQPVFAQEEQEEDDCTDTDEFATPPTSTHTSPALTPWSQSGAPMWPVKAGNALDRSNAQISSLHPVACSKLASEYIICDIQLHHNLFAALPDSLTFFADSLTTLCLAHNQLTGETYLGGGDDLIFPSLKELDLSSNHITALTPLINRLIAPKLEKLDVSVNRIASLPSTVDKERGGRLLREAFPSLTILLMPNNHVAELDPESIRGMKIVDAANNDIAHLNPKIGLLGGRRGLERLVVTGNRFRVPRWNVIERGTQATLRWLRGRVPVAEMAAWKGERNGSTEELSGVESGSTS